MAGWIIYCESGECRGIIRKLHRWKTTKPKNLFCGYKYKYKSSLEITTLSQNSTEVCAIIIRGVASKSEVWFESKVVVSK